MKKRLCLEIVLRRMGLQKWETQFPPLGRLSPGPANRDYKIHDRNSGRF